VRELSRPVDRPTDRQLAALDSHDAAPLLRADMVRTSLLLRPVAGATTVVELTERARNTIAV
jgi:hypothetical protein